MRKLTLCALLSVFIPHSFAEEPETLHDIHKARKALLEAIVTHTERQFQEGNVDVDDLFDARLNLSRFQQDLAADLKEKKQFQSEIVEIEKRRLALIERHYAKGDEGMLEVLQAREQLLAARQKLMEIETQLRSADATQPPD